MDRRTFLLGLFGGLAAAAGLAPTGGTPALARSPDPTPPPDGVTEAADIKPEDSTASRPSEPSTGVAGVGDIIAGMGVAAGDTGAAAIGGPLLAPPLLAP